jgi:uncharacterized protein (TIGR00255 family)
MIRSMTGFGEAERDTAAGRLRVEIKTVNHRFFNASIRTPAGFDRFEHMIQGWLREQVARGHVNCSISLDRSSTGSDAEPMVDLGRAARYKEALDELKRALDLTGDVDLAQVARFGEIFRTPDAGEDRTVDAADLEAVVKEALAGLVSMRDAEGGHTHADVVARLDALDAQIDVVEARAPERLIAERDRLREAIRELADSEQVDEDRLAREMAYLAEKWDINEELVRFRAHVQAFRETASPASPEPVGKRLGFILQEMHREANTIGSKANDLEITAASVAMKEEIERLREQLENVE